ncbi:EpsG family protein [Aquirufa sp. ROCK-SH2]
MIVYWGMFFVLVVLNLIFSSAEKGSKMTLIFSFFIIFLYLSLRGDFAGDYYSYEDIYNLSNTISIDEELPFTEKIELGFIILNKILPSYRFVIIFLSAFTCYTYFTLFHKYILPQHYFFGFILMAMCGGFMLFFQMSSLRNAITINILSLSIPYILNRKWGAYLILIFIGSFFHKTILIFMPLTYFISNPNKFTFKTKLIWFISALSFSILSKITLINSIAPLINLYFDKYAVYTLAAEDMSNSSSIILYFYVFITLILTLLISKYIKLRHEIIIIKNSLLFILALLLGALNFRMSHYFAPFFLLSIIIVYTRVKNRQLKYAYILINLFYLTYSFYIFTKDQYFSYSSYYTMFNNLY